MDSITTTEVNTQEQGPGQEVAQEPVSNEALGSAISEKGEAEAAGTDHRNEEHVSEDAQYQDDPMAAKFAALSRKEKALRDREAQIEARLQQFEEKMQQFQQPQTQEPETEAEEPIDVQLRKDPLNVLKKFGWDYEKLTQMQLDDGKLPMDVQMNLMKEELKSEYQQKIEELENKLTQAEEQRENEKYEQTINNFINELGEFVDSNSQQYELIKANEATDLVFDVIEEHYNEHGEVLDKKDAADMVEKYLQEELEKTLKSTSKYRSFLEKPEPQQEPSPSVNRQPRPTLSNAHSAVASPKAERKLSEDESKAKAANLLKWLE